jgi:Family of unknown function (DUF5996)
MIGNAAHDSRLDLNLTRAFRARSTRRLSRLRYAPTMERAAPNEEPSAWPELPLAAWEDTYATLHLWTQIIGKVRLALAPLINHWWQATLYVTPRGLTTSPIPRGTRTFAIELDFIDHTLRFATSDGELGALPLQRQPVADFYAATMAALRSLDLEVSIRSTPVEIDGPIPFELDRRHASYDPDAAQRFWRVLVQANRVFTDFRSRFIGKVSPVHFFWGAFDLAVTRFSGRRAPRHGPVPNVPDFVVQEAYSHEVSSLGFWPGGGPVSEPVFYAYAYPEPEGFKETQIAPSGAYYSQDLGEFLLPYEIVRSAPSPDAALLAFAQSTYEAAADLAGWERAALER